MTVAQRARKAGAYGAVRPGRRGRRQRACRRGCRASPTSSRSTWAAPAPTSACPRRPAAGHARSRRSTALPIRIAGLDINAIGAGGGSIAWIDDGGALRVGPRSAGRRAGAGLLRPRRHASRPSPTPISCSAGSARDTRLGGELTLDVAAARGRSRPHRRTARSRPDRSGLRHPARRQRDDGPRHPRRLGRARP